jgi:hypothetical protein
MFFIARLARFLDMIVLFDILYHGTTVTPDLCLYVTQGIFTPLSILINRLPFDSCIAQIYTDILA